MIIFQLCTLGLASLVEYRFGRNFGSKFYDYSGNGNHGLNGDGSSPSMVMSTDRGIYLNGGTSHVMVEKQFNIPSIFSVIIWLITLDVDGKIFFRGGPNYYEILREKSGEKSVLNAKLNSDYFSDHGGGKSFDASKFYLDIWQLITLNYDGTNFKMLINAVEKIDKKLASYADSSTYITTIGSKSGSIQGFIWWFIVLGAQSTPSSYIDIKTSLNSTCMIPNISCDSCKVMFKDFEYGTGCLSLNTNQSQNSKESNCPKTGIGCADTGYNYECPNQTVSCVYNSKINKCYNKKFEDGSETEVRCNLQSIVCPSNCQSCQSNNVCTSCKEILAIISSGTCVCKTGTYLNNDSQCACNQGTYFDISSQTCLPCGVGCISCSLATKCDTCPNNAQESAGSCSCNTGFYFSDVKICSACPSGCSQCDSSKCISCLDANSEPNGQNCVCKAGYSGTPCRYCTGLCLECNANSICTKCVDINATPNGNNCICSSGYILSGNICNRVCGAGCNTCDQTSACIGCIDSNSIVSKNE